MLRKIWKITRALLIVLLLLIVGGYFALQQHGFQTWLGHRVADYLGHKLGTIVRIDKVGIDLWARMRVEGLYIEDLHQDTLLWVPQLWVQDYQFDAKTGKLEVNQASLDEPVISLKRYQGETNLNYAFIVDYFSAPTDTSDTSITRVFMDKIQLRNGRFEYSNENRPPRGVYGFDWNYIFLDNVNLTASKLAVLGDSVSTYIENLSAHDISGFTVNEISTSLAIVPGEVRMTKTHIITPQSDLDGDLSFKVNSIDDFDDFEHLVKMNHRLRKSKIQLGDIAFFSSDLAGIDKVIEVSGKFKGEVANLKGRDVEIRFGNNSAFKGSFGMEGLPEIDETFISLDIDDLTTNKWELDQLPLPPFDSLNYLKTPNNFAQLGQVHFTGSFTGFINDFVAYGELGTDIGKVKSDIALRRDTASNDYFYKGGLATTAFDLGKFYSTTSIGPLTCDLNVEGKGLNVETMDVKFSGVISELFANQYNYHNIDAEGTFRQKFFDGMVSVSDPNAMVDFTGQIDFSQKIPLMKFQSEIANLDLKAVHLLSDFEYSSVSASLSVDSKGLNFEQFEGTVHVNDVSYCSKNKEYFIDHFDIESKRQNGYEINLNSDIAVGTLKGEVDLKELGLSLQDILSEVIPNFQPPIREHKTQNFELKLEVLDFSEIQGVFIPELSLAPHSRLRMNVDEPNSVFKITFTSDNINYDGNVLENVVVDAHRPDEFVYFNILTDRLKVSEDVVFEQFAIDARSDRDTIYTDMVWGDSTTTHRGEIITRFNIRGYQNVDILFDQSQFTINNETWQFAKGGNVSIDSTHIAVNDITIYNGMQVLWLGGAIAEDPEQSLDLTIGAFDLSNVNPFMDDDTKLYGLVSGSASMRNVYEKPIFTSDLSLADFKLNEYLFGDLCLESKWNNDGKSLWLDGSLEKNALKPLTFTGSYNVNEEKSPLDIFANVQDLDLSFLNEFVGEDVLGISGFVSGKIHVTGLPEAPEMNGRIGLRDASVFVPYLNTRYYLEQSIGIYPDMFTFDRIRIRDEEGNPGYLTGTILHNAFGDWNFDMVIDAETPLLAMNTNEMLNSLYYGKAYTTGMVGISGFEDQLEFDIKLRSEKGTKLAMPMNSTDDISFENFIRFVDKDSEVPEAALDLSGIKLNMELDITPDAEFQIIFDQAVGDVMSGTGKGHLSMEINNLSTFTMYGQVELTKGNYLFTLKNLLNKEFTIRPGGTITWFGDPFAADLNLQAVYKVSASLSEIIADASRNYGQRVPVDLIMNLTGKMFSPGVDFDVNLPTLDQVTKSRVESIISSDQERNRQAFALLVLRKFVSPPNTTTTANTLNPIVDNSNELLSSQISNWLSQISSDFDLGFNYRPGDEISNEEIALALSTQLFNDRLSLSGNFGVSRGNTANSNPTNYIGDIRIEYKITRDGKIRLLVYNESNDYRMAAIQQSLYTQGVGLMYQEEFNTLDEFYCGFKNMFRSSDSKRICN
jgi:hypothetical protein